MAALRRSRRLAQVLIRIKIELGFALRAAEVIRLPVVLFILNSPCVPTQLSNGGSVRLSKSAHSRSARRMSAPTERYMNHSEAHGHAADPHATGNVSGSRRPSPSRQALRRLCFAGSSVLVLHFRRIRPALVTGWQLHSPSSI